MRTIVQNVDVETFEEEDDKTFNGLHRSKVNIKQDGVVTVDKRFMDG